MTIRGAARALLIAGIVASSLVPSRALAVVPVWTTLFDAGVGLPIGSVGYQGSLYVLLWARTSVGSPDWTPPAR